MKLDFFDEFTDPYLKTNRGKLFFWRELLWEL